MAKRKRSWEEDLAEVDQKDNESLNEDNESLNEDIAMDSGSSTKTEDGPNALSESNCQKGKCIVAVAQKLRIQHEYMHLVGAINGERYHWPGVGTRPAFLVPAYHLNGEQYLAQELIRKFRSITVSVLSKPVYFGCREPMQTRRCYFACRLSRAYADATCIRIYTFNVVGVWA